MECRLEEGIWFNINRDEVPFWQIFLLVKLGVKLICNYWTIFTEDKARSHLTGGSGELFQSLKIFILCILTVITNTKSISLELQIWKTIRTVHFRTRGKSFSLSLKYRSSPQLDLLSCQKLRFVIKLSLEQVFYRRKVLLSNTQ